MINHGDRRTAELRETGDTTLARPQVMAPPIQDTNVNGALAVTDDLTIGGTLAVTAIRR